MSLCACAATFALVGEHCLAVVKEYWDGNRDAEFRQKTFEINRT